MTLQTYANDVTNNRNDVTNILFIERVRLRQKYLLSHDAVIAYKMARAKIVEQLFALSRKKMADEHLKCLKTI